MGEDDMTEDPAIQALIDLDVQALRVQRYEAAVELIRSTDVLRELAAVNRLPRVYDLERLSAAQYAYDVATDECDYRFDTQFKRLR